MLIPSSLSKAALFVALVFLLPVAAMAAAPSDTAIAGKVTTLSGDKIAQARAADGAIRKLVVGDTVYVSDSISTGKDTTLVILFLDESRFAIGSKTEVLVEKFIYDQSSATGAFHTRFVKGVFRFISGKIAKYKNRDMQVNISVAVLGVRGTRVEGEVSDRHEKNGIMVDASARVVLLEPDDKDEKTSISVSNAFGSVIVDQPGYGTEIPDEKSPPSPVRKMQLQTVDNVLRSLRSSTRQGGTPRPRM